MHSVTDTGGTAVLYDTEIAEGAVGATSPISDGDAAGATVQLSSSATLAAFIFRIAQHAELMGIRLEPTPERPVRLSLDHGGPNFGNDGVLSFALKPDGTAALYSWGYYGSEGGGGVEQFYYVDTAAATPGEPLGLGGQGFGSVGKLAANGSRFVISDGVRVSVVDTSGRIPSSPLVVSDPLVRGGSLRAVAVSDNGNRLAYLADAETVGVPELYVVDLSGAAPGRPRKVSGNLASGLSVGYDFLFAPSGEQIAYLVGTGAPTRRWELYLSDLSVVPTAAPTRVNGDLVAGGSVGDGATPHAIARFSFTSNNKFLVYAADQLVAGRQELFVSDVTTSTPTAATRVSGAMQVNGDVLGYQIAPDGSGLVYLSDQVADEVAELYFVNLRPAAPSAPQRLNGDLPAGGDVAGPTFDTPNVAFSGDGRFVAYAADQTANDKVEVWLSDVATGVVSDAVRLQSTENPRSVVSDVAFSRDGEFLLWLAAADDAVTDLWLADMRSAGRSVAKLNTARPVQSFRVAP